MAVLCQKSSSYIQVDENGYPSAGIPQTVNLPDSANVGLRVRKMLSAGGRLELGDYVFLYDGQGTFTFNGGMTINSSSPGRVELTCNSEGNLWMDIMTSSPAPNHLRNFRLIPADKEATYITEPWNEHFLEKLAPFTTLRFMEWSKTNLSERWLWEQRTLPTYHSQTTRAGVAYEYAIELCNLMQKDAWVNVPHMANPDYITQMATLFKNNLNPNLKIYLEYSNETWNWGYQQAHWIIQQMTYAPPGSPLNDLYDPTKSYAYNSGLLSKRVFEIWKNVFGAGDQQVQRVLGTQAVWPTLISVDNIKAVNSNYDYLSPAAYFGRSPSDIENYDANTTAQQIINDCRNEFFVERINTFKEQYYIADTSGAKIIHYEAGQHISAYGIDEHPALQAMYDAQVHPDMYNLYNEVLDSLRAWGSELIVPYILAGTNSKYGSWGHLQTVEGEATISNAPKYVALIDNLPENGACNNNLPIINCSCDNPLIDGYVDNFWQQTSSFSCNKLGGGGSLPSSDLSANWRVTFNEDLFLLIEVTDDIAVRDSGNQPYHDDAVEVFLDPDFSQNTSYDPNDIQLVFARGDSNYFAFQNGQEVNYPGVSFAQTETATGYNIEIQIPHEVLGLSSLESNTIGIDIHIADDDDGNLKDHIIVWEDDTDMAWGNTALFGSVSLNTCQFAQSILHNNNQVINSGIYQAENIQSQATITSNNNLIEYRASQKIRLGNDFNVSVPIGSGRFKARIFDCE